VDEFQVDEFEGFVREAEPRLRRALIGARGPVDGRDATAEALAYAWEHWETVKDMSNAVGYLYRVGQSRTRPRRTVRVPARTPDEVPAHDPALVEALKALTEPQRVSVFLVHGCGWPHADVGKVLDVTASTVATHVQRGLTKLRQQLEVTADG
jgi:DNA-directed RNA polymerase specialized sigma24 family protein